MQGNLIIISSPSGGGKGTLIRETLTTVADLAYSVSFTTREIRRGEMDRREYFFVTRKKFSELIANDEFLEYAEVHGNFYGTSAKQVEKEISLGRDVVLEIDVQGAATVLARMPDAVSIFIMPPSFETLRRRLLKRATDDKYAIELRLKNSSKEVARYEMFEYVVVNREIQQATRELCSIILAERLRRIRQKDGIRLILNSFEPE